MICFALCIYAFLINPGTAIYVLSDNYTPDVFLSMFSFFTVLTIANIEDRKAKVCTRLLTPRMAMLLS